MKKENILNYLDEKLAESIPEYDFALDFDSRNHTIEIIFRLFAENQGNDAITDADGIISDQEIIEFEDAVLLYQPEKSQFDVEDYLTTIQLDGKKGIQQSVADALSIYLKRVLDEGLSDLLDFLNDEEAEDFELKWGRTTFENILADQPEAAKASWLSYPKY